MMHFAMPPRKSSNPSPFAPRTSRIPIPNIRKTRLKRIIVSGTALILLVLVLWHTTRGGGEHIPFGTPAAVLITVVQPDLYSKQYIDNIKQNRNEYAAKHGYETLFAQNGDYDLGGAPRTWTKVPAMRHAMSKYPHTKYFWFLDQNALIMNPDLTIDKHLMEHKRLDSLMLKDQPIVPPASVIKTFPQLRGEHIDFVIAQDKDGLSSTSFVLKQGEWAKFFLDTWFDPLYRSYNFQKAEAHALEHIVQWHPTILSKLAIVPQRIINSYDKGDANAAFRDGDFVIRFAGCEIIATRDCETAADPFTRQWRTIFRSSR